MRPWLIGIASAGMLFALANRAAASTEHFSATIRGNVANQQIVGFRASTATWDLKRGFVSIVSRARRNDLLVVAVKGLIIPALGFNPSPDLLARVVCHDETGTPAEVARTRAVPMSPEGDATLIDGVSIPGACFAPVVLLTGSVDPDGEMPGKWFGVSGF